MDTIVKTRDGMVEGFKEEGLNKWLGVPFAEPPVGELRFRRAKECRPWAGVKSCKKIWK